MVPQGWISVYTSHSMSLICIQLQKLNDYWFTSNWFTSMIQCEYHKCVDVILVDIFRSDSDVLIGCAFFNASTPYRCQGSMLWKVTSLFFYLLTSNKLFFSPFSLKYLTSFEIRENFFTRRVINQWNDMPLEVKQTKDVTTFKILIWQTLHKMKEEHCYNAQKCALAMNITL